MNGHPKALLSKTWTPKDLHCAAWSPRSHLLPRVRPLTSQVNVTQLIWRHNVWAHLSSRVWLLTVTDGDGLVCFAADALSRVFASALTNGGGPASHSYLTNKGNRVWLCCSVKTMWCAVAVGYLCCGGKITTSIFHLLMRSNNIQLPLQN